MEITVIGGGLAGCEAAWAIAQRGVAVRLYEMKPLRRTPAHSSDLLCELVCSNSLKAEQMSNAIRSGQARPVENGTQAQAPSVTTFDYAHASREQREALKRQIREAAARGQKIYPGK